MIKIVLFQELKFELNLLGLKLFQFSTKLMTHDIILIYSVITHVNVNNPPVISNSQ